MCGRYKLSAKSESVWAHFDLHGEQLPLLPRFNIAPTQPVAMIRVPQQLEVMRWGIHVPNPKAGGFNVRVESLGAPFYRASIRERRCLIIADGFYEWKPLVEAKKPFLVQRTDGEPFAFAGIWDRATLKTGEVVDACAILTTAVIGVVSSIHTRMPVILPTNGYAAWLDPASKYRNLLEPEVGSLQLVPVSNLVNSTRNDDARLVEPLTDVS
jgi:putative SOS response-associated peptidase YedK